MKMNSTTIKIKDKEYNLRYTIRAFFLFERITGKSIQFDTFADQFVFFYCLLIASNPDIDLTFDQFIDAIDNQEIDIDAIKNFVNNQQQKQEELRDKTDDSKKKGSKKKS